MDYMESVTFVTKDAKWMEKIGLGALATLLSCIIVGALALAGWAMEAFRRVINGADEKLPGWTNWTAYLGDGLKYVGVVVIWSIPAAILRAPDSGLLHFVAFLVSLVVSFLSIGAFIILTQTGDFVRALNPMNAWELLNKNLSKWIVTALIIWAASIVASLVGGIVCGIGLLVTIPWLAVATANLVGRTVLETGTEV